MVSTASQLPLRRWGEHEDAWEESYTWPGSNWRPSAREADVIATRPQVLLASSPLDPVLSFQIDLDSAEKPYPEALLHKN